MVHYGTVLFFLCSTMTSAFCCDWLRHYAHVNERCLTLLNEMGRQPSEHRRSPVPFPSKLYANISNAKAETKLLFIRDNLEQILHLYHSDNLSSSPEDRSKIKKLLECISRQIEGLKSCVSVYRTSNKELRRYYRKLRRRTMCCGSGPAHNELIRKEIKLHLQRLHILVNSMVVAAAASRRCNPSARL
ncbi:interferon a3-like, partial [Thalassophryne amazonica]|uniref:interferon a3-like n=1 Tax=Thalassophryne amazonica TaxID=390379 RepID=UPI0014716413